MSQADNPDAAHDTDNLGRRIKTQIRELQEKGELSEAHKAYLTDTEEKRAQIEQKLSAAIRQGKIGEALKAEALRDYRAILDGLSRFVERLDAASTKAERR